MEAFQKLAVLQLGALVELVTATTVTLCLISLSNAHLPGTMLGGQYPSCSYFAVMLTVCLKMPLGAMLTHNTDLRMSVGCAGKKPHCTQITPKVGICSNDKVTLNRNTHMQEMSLVGVKN